ncbi:hypothetical protein [Streptomyces chumphonensis]|uniref:hypothetical protein n=1 Tax=Streptomyces chumphonensis TaxID=1214925 RepID=UPI003D72A369
MSWIRRKSFTATTHRRCQMPRRRHVIEPGETYWQVSPTPEVDVALSTYMVLDVCSRCTPPPVVPVPSGCGWCGIPERGHGRQWRAEPGWHAWAAPPQEQILARMRERRAMKTGGAS